MGHFTQSTDRWCSDYVTMFYFAHCLPFEDSQPCDTWLRVNWLPVNNWSSTKRLPVLLKSDFNIPNCCLQKQVWLQLSNSYISSCERDTARICCWVPCCGQCSSADGGERLYAPCSATNLSHVGAAVTWWDRRTWLCHRLYSIYYASSCQCTLRDVTTLAPTLLRHTSSHQPGPPPTPLSVKSFMDAPYWVCSL